MERDSRSANGSIALLEARDPVWLSDLAGEGIEGALDEIGAAITSLQSPAPRRRRMGIRLRVLVVAATMLAIAAGVAAGAGVFGAHTGRFPTKAEQAIGGPGEALNPAAPDFRAVALQIASDIPYPKGYASWREWVL